jgi:O-antigen biosynthesis protein
MPAPPLFSVITPVFDPPPYALRAAIRSVRRQRWPDWELILVDDGSTSPLVRRILRRARAADRRIRLIERPTNGGIAAASNDGIDIAAGEFVVLLDHDDELTVDALAVLAQAVTTESNVDYLYSDEDKIDETGHLADRFDKPEWSPERLRNQMYTAHLSALRTELVRLVGGFRTGFDGSQDHDLVLRVTELARRVVHIPKVLYHWRVVPGSGAGDDRAKPHAWSAGQRAVQEHLGRVGISGTVDLGPMPGTYRIHRRVDPQTTVSLIVPTRGSSGVIWGERRCFVVEAIRTALARTKLPYVEAVVVYDAETPEPVLEQVRDLAGDRLRLVRSEGRFNFSTKCNLGVLAAKGEVIVLLNDDIEVISDGWLERLIAPLSEPDVGMVGARLLFSDGTVQHGGHVYQHRALLNAYQHAAGDDPGLAGALLINRECAGVTAACAALRRSVFEEVGGLCEALPVNFNDVDLSYKLRHIGLRLLWLADVELYHFESQTRVAEAHAWETAFVFRRWGTPARDPYLPGPRS